MALLAKIPAISLATLLTRDRKTSLATAKNLVFKTPAVLTARTALTGEANGDRSRAVAQVAPMVLRWGSFPHRVVLVADNSRHRACNLEVLAELDKLAVAWGNFHRRE
jgi:hypothetical protein